MGQGTAVSSVSCVPCELIVMQPLADKLTLEKGRKLCYNCLYAGVTQLAECLLPKQNVVGSNPITRSTGRMSS